MTIQVVGIKVGRKLDNFAFAIEFDEKCVLVDELLACGAPAVSKMFNRRQS